MSQSVWFRVKQPPVQGYNLKLEANSKIEGHAPEKNVLMAHPGNSRDIFLHAEP